VATDRFLQPFEARDLIKAAEPRFPACCALGRIALVEAPKKVFELGVGL
jgi:hypothetical protein